MAVPGWYVDPENDEMLRLFDGAAWTDDVQPHPGLAGGPADEPTRDSAAPEDPAHHNPPATGPATGPARDEPDGSGAPRHLAAPVPALPSADVPTGPAPRRPRRGLPRPSTGPTHTLAGLFITPAGTPRPAATQYPQPAGQPLFPATHPTRPGPHTATSRPTTGRRVPNPRAAGAALRDRLSSSRTPTGTVGQVRHLSADIGSGIWLDPTSRALHQIKVLLRRLRFGGAQLIAGGVAGGMLVALLLVGWETYGTRIQGDRAQARLEEALTAQRAQVDPADAPAEGDDDPTVAVAAAAPAAPTTTKVPAADPTTLTIPADGTPVGQIRIPRIGVDAVFVAGTDTEELAQGPGLWRDGVVPGQAGNATISAHRTTYGAWFNRIDELNPGDRIEIDIPGQPLAVYEVRAQFIVRPEDGQVTYQTPGVRLTLTSCHPKGSARQRIIVQAELVEGANVGLALPANQWAPQR